jgi:hypothetical protein
MRNFQSVVVWVDPSDHSTHRVVLHYSWNGETLNMDDVSSDSKASADIVPDDVIEAERLDCERFLLDHEYTEREKFKRAGIIEVINV